MMFIYTSVQIGIFILFLLMALLRLFGDESDFVYYVSLLSIPVSLLVVLYTA
ncbi:hypothetical protein [Psychrobacillus sp. BM2]|uniref:hypothetical protein n=1 Tax=Psychrobacillus sp. BM2 TaxID=3400421 RepID=UPI003B013261